MFSKWFRPDYYEVIRNKYRTQIDLDIKNNVDQKIREYVAGEKYKKICKEHVEKYPIDSYVEYLGIKMKVVDNMKSAFDYSSSCSAYNNMYVGKAVDGVFIKIDSIPCVSVEWADSTKVIHTRKFEGKEFDKLKIVEEKK